MSEHTVHVEHRSAFLGGDFWIAYCTCGWEGTHNPGRFFDDAARDLARAQGLIHNTEAHGD